MKALALGDYYGKDLKDKVAFVTRSRDELRFQADLSDKTITAAMQARTEEMNARLKDIVLNVYQSIEKLDRIESLIQQNGDIIATESRRIADAMDVGFAATIENQSQNSQTMETKMTLAMEKALEKSINKLLKQLSDRDREVERMQKEDNRRENEAEERAREYRRKDMANFLIVMLF
jgi:hypothetical protein